MWRFALVFVCFGLPVHATTVSQYDAQSLVWLSLNSVTNARTGDDISAQITRTTWDDGDDGYSVSDTGSSTFITWSPNARGNDLSMEGRVSGHADATTPDTFAYVAAYFLPAFFYHGPCDRDGFNCADVGAALFSFDYEISVDLSSTGDAQFHRAEASLDYGQTSDYGAFHLSEIEVTSGQSRGTLNFLVEPGGQLFFRLWTTLDAQAHAAPDRAPDLAPVPVPGGLPLAATALLSLALLRRRARA